MVQGTLERIVVHCVTDEPLLDTQKAALTDLIQTKLGYEFELEILDQRNDLPRRAGGKFEEFISKVLRRGLLVHTSFSALTAA